MPARVKKIEAERPRPLHAGGDGAAHFMEASPDCIKMLDLDGRMLSVNARGLQALEICDFAVDHNTLALGVLGSECAGVACLEELLHYCNALLDFRKV